MPLRVRRKLQRCLGKLPAVPDPRIPRLRTLITGRAAPPLNINWYDKVASWPMLANDRIGDCVIAYVLHCIQQRMAYAGKPVAFADNEAEALYESWGGWNPADPKTDDGMLMTDALAAWARSGVVVPGGVDTITGLASIDHSMLVPWIRFAIWKFGGVGLGIICPRRWVEEVRPGGVLDVPGYLDPDEIAGGHAVYLAGVEMMRNGTFVFAVVTWGDLYHMTGRALRIVGDEAHCVLDRDWTDAQGIDPAGVDWAAANAAIQSLQR
jgi:hypothetical protein